MVVVLLLCTLAVLGWIVLSHWRHRVNGALHNRQRLKQIIMERMEKDERAKRDGTST